MEDIDYPRHLLDSFMLCEEKIDSLGAFMRLKSLEWSPDLSLLYDEYRSERAEIVLVAKALSLSDEEKRAMRKLSAWPDACRQSALYLGLI